MSEAMEQLLSNADRLSNLQDGDILMLKTDELISEAVFAEIKDRLRSITGKKIGLIAFGLNDSLSVAFNAQQLKDGDTVVVKGDDSGPEELAMLRKALSQFTAAKFLVLGLDSDKSIDVIKS